MAAKKPTLFQQAKKEIKRIEKAAKRISGRGYEFDNIPYLKEKKRYTRKDVEKLQKVKSKDLYQYATAYGMSGERYRELERSRAAQKAAQTMKEREIELNKPFSFDARESYKEFVSISRSIIDMFLDKSNFRNYDNGLSEGGYQLVVDFVEEAINDPEIGINVLAQCLQDNKDIMVEVQASYDRNVQVNLIKLGRALDQIVNSRKYEEMADIIDLSNSYEDGLIDATPEQQNYIDHFGSGEPW